MIDPELEDLQLFWKKMWLNQEDPFEQQDVLRDSDCVDVEVPETCKVLCHLPNVFRHDDALVRKEYEEALEAIKGYETTQKAVVVVGHPGIGMVLVFLIKRAYSPKAFLFREDHFLVLHIGSPLVAWPANSFPIRRRIYSSL
jgi:hypothetical protein